MLSKQRIKFIKSLQLKKFRNEEQLFLVQGKKNIEELLQSDFEIDTLLITDKFRDDLSKIKQDYELVTQKELERISSLQTNNAGLAVVKYKQNRYIDSSDEFVLVLDRVQDPGNLGTIIRIADWYGIQKIVCSDDSVDCYNPKVINATMGSFTRVDVFYEDLKNLFETHEKPVIGAVLGGQTLYDTKREKGSFLLMGNESQGISEELLTYITHKVTIPKVGKAESLNVGVATGIICDHFLRVQ